MPAVAVPVDCAGPAAAEGVAAAAASGGEAIELVQGAFRRCFAAFAAAVAAVAEGSWPASAVAYLAFGPSVEPLPAAASSPVGAA